VRPKPHSGAVADRRSRGIADDERSRNAATEQPALPSVDAAIHPHSRGRRIRTYGGISDVTLSRSNPHAKPRWFALLVLVCIGLAFAASAVSALTTANPPSFSFVSDESGANDLPGQKDLTAHAIANSSTAGAFWVAWKWDDTSWSGNNTGDACALFDTDGDGKVNSAICVTVGGKPLASQQANSPRVYTCGDTKVDRCTTPITLVSPIQSACSVNPAATPTYPNNPSGNDTQATCHVWLADLGVTTAAALINTCSYPSQQPNSDPSDCVLIPRDAFLVIVKVATPDEGLFPFHIDANATAAFTASGSDTSTQIAISSTQAHTLKEAIPANWAITGTPSCTGTSGPGSSNGTFNGTDTITGIDASSDNVVTCTFNDQLQSGSILVTKDDGTNLLGGAGFTIDPGTPEDETDDIVMTEGATGVFCTDGLSFGDYTVTESTVPGGYNGADPVDVTVDSSSDCGDRVDENGAPVGDPDAEFTNSPAPGSVTVQKNDDDGNGLEGVGFTLYVDIGTVGTYEPAVDVTVAAAEVDSDATGLVTFSSVPPGYYCAVETSPLDGYAAADPNWACGQLAIEANASLDLGTFVNEQEHTIIVLVCHDATDTLAPSDVTIGTETLESLGAGTLTADEQKALCDLGGATFGGLVHGETDVTVDVGSGAHN